MLMIKVTLLLLIICNATAKTLRFKSESSVSFFFWSDARCKSMTKTTAIDITPCSVIPNENAREASKYCKVIRGAETTLKLSFTTKELKGIDPSKLKVYLHGKRIIWLPLTLKNDDLCDGKGLTCPIESNKSYSFELVVPIQSYFPEMKSIPARITVTSGNVCLMCNIINLSIPSRS